MHATSVLLSLSLPPSLFLSLPPRHFAFCSVSYREASYYILDTGVTRQSTQHSLRHRRCSFLERSSLSMIRRVIVRSIGSFLMFVLFIYLSIYLSIYFERVTSNFSSNFLPSLPSPLNEPRLSRSRSMMKKMKEGVINGVRCGE